MLTQPLLNVLGSLLTESFGAGVQSLASSWVPNWHTLPGTPSLQEHEEWSPVLSLQ